LGLPSHRPKSRRCSSRISRSRALPNQCQFTVSSSAIARVQSPVEDPAFEMTSLFEDELVAILPAEMTEVPKKVTPAFLSRCPLILVNEGSALRRTVGECLAHAGPPPKPLMEFDNVEPIKSVVAGGGGWWVGPWMGLGRGDRCAAGKARRAPNPL